MLLLVFPTSAKNCKTFEIFSGILTLNFREVRCFISPFKNQRFYFPPKTVYSCSSRWHAHLCCTKTIENLWISDRWPFLLIFFFFFGERQKIQDKMLLSARWLFLGRKPKFCQKIIAALIENTPRTVAFSHWVQNFRTVSGIYAGGEKLEVTQVTVVIFCNR